ncbi:MAG: ribosome assembly factor SBDS [Candidatus Nanohaloarchaeota archaeon QJJ-9]|nr:ribosome assembly factor SBDS [Candidatus Nanohaloarchaeota archaeon QJJ-9]
MDSDQAIRVEYKGDPDFEILVKPDEALDYRQGKMDNFEKVLFVREVFNDARAAEKASANEIEDEFGTKRIVEAAKKLFKDGRMALTTEQKNQLRKEKKKQVVSKISKKAMNPQTNSPHPPERIENAMEESGVHIDPMKPIDSQMQDTVDAIKSKLPITMEKKEIAVKIPNKYAGKCYSKMKNIATVKDEEWGDEAFMAKVTIPAGMIDKLETELNSVCHGDLDIKDI